MKFCPGECCEVWLPLHQFSVNSNTPDNLDTYCIECNHRKRSDRRRKRNRFQESGTTEIEDAFVLFCRSKDAFEEERQNARFDAHSRSLTKIDRALVHCRLHLEIDVPFDSSYIHRKLFGERNMICNRTDEPLTESCFVDHHSLSFNKRGKRLDIVCSDCTAPKYRT